MPLVHSDWACACAKELVPEMFRAAGIVIGARGTDRGLIGAFAGAGAGGVVGPEGSPLLRYCKAADTMSCMPTPFAPQLSAATSHRMAANRRRQLSISPLSVYIQVRWDHRTT